MSTTKPNNKLTQRTLYAIGDIIFTNLSNNLSPFAEYKSKYIPGLVITYRGRRTSAMGLPNSEELSSIYELYRVHLIPLKDFCCKDSQKLKGYIDDAFTKAERAAMYKAAGGNYYKAASNENWESVTEMNNMKKRFITNNLAALMLHDNMPAGFQTQESGNDDDFATGLGLFMDSKQTGTGKNLKLDANNLSYEDISSIASDALKLEGVDNEFLKLFDLTALQNSVSPKGSASLKLIIKLAIAFTFIEGAIVTIQAEGEPAITLIADANGMVHFINVDPLNYTVTITATGKIPVTFKKDVDTGTNAHKDVLMELVPPPVVAVVPPAV